MSNKPEIKYLKGVGPKRAEAFKKLGLQFVSDLFTVYPREYVLNTTIKALAKHTDKVVLICAEITDKKMPYKPNHPTKLIIADNTGYTEVLVWGNAFYRERQFKVGEKYLFLIKVSYSNFGLQTDIRDHKKFEAFDEEMLKYPYIPLYIVSGELRKTWINSLTLTKIIFNALKKYSDEIKEVLSEQVRNEYGLFEHKQAILRMHYPRSEEEKEHARQTAAFEELFYLQLVSALRRKRIESEEKGIAFEKAGDKPQKLFDELLGFELTGAQKRVIKEIRADMKKDKPMNRLLQGDVGSGKTIVAVFCMLVAIESGYQCAFMCPTEILAEQHYKVLKGYFDRLGVNIVQLVGGQKKKMRESILNEIKTGKANVVAGTHALIQEKVEFNNLGFIVIDEQHKFGVMQRARLREKSSGTGLNPDIMVMTATPIPRTLSLTYYGDLDVSVIDELPKNRKQVKTGLRFESDRLNVYKFIREEVKKGRQVYIVYPIIDESEKLDLKSAAKHYEILKKNVFPELNVALIHGRLFWYEIDEIINEFKEGKIDILVTTTVIEVGIDIPNATIMVIEEAQRFGLSQLHQLRGRVGRGADQSYCILMASGQLSEITSKRLNIMIESTDGFKIADMDLKLRGPGEFFGIRQSGELKFSAADLVKDQAIVDNARKSAFRLAEDDPQLRKKENEIIKENFLLNYRESMSLIKVA